MSYLLTMNAGSVFCRLGFAGIANASKQASAAIASGPAVAASINNGQFFTAKYYHTLRQKREEKSILQKSLVPMGTSSKSSLVISNRLMSGSGDHVTLWTAERILSAALVPILPLALITPCAPLDYMLAFGLTMHSHWGIEAIVVDYVRPSVFGPVIPKLALALVYGLSAMTLGGLFYFIYSDVGLGQAIRMLWKL